MTKDLKTTDNMGFDKTMQQFMQMLPVGSHIIHDDTEYEILGIHITETKPKYFWQKKTKSYQFDVQEKITEHFSNVKNIQNLLEERQKLKQAYDANAALSKYYSKRNHELYAQAAKATKMTKFMMDKITELKQFTEEATDGKIEVTKEMLDKILQDVSELGKKEKKDDRQKNSSTNTRSNGRQSTVNSVQHSKKSYKTNTRRPNKSDR